MNGHEEGGTNVLQFPLGNSIILQGSDVAVILQCMSQHYSVWENCSLFYSSGYKLDNLQKKKKSLQIYKGKLLKNFL